MNTNKTKFVYKPEEAIMAFINGQELVIANNPKR